jgi:hypothetical protein
MKRGPNFNIVLEINELYVPLLAREGLGTLYSANCSTAKPADISDETWTASLLDAFISLTASNFQKCTKTFQLVLQSSFWRPNSESHILQKSDIIGRLIHEPISIVEVIDEFCGVDNLNPDTPIESIARIFTAMQSGVDIVILSRSKQISGFIPAVLSRISNPQCPIVKLWYPITIGEGYNLTAFQLGYLYGLSDVALTYHHGTSTDNDKRR